MGARSSFSSVWVLLLLALWLPAATGVEARRGYVTDKLEVQMRAGQGTQHKIVKLLASGMALTLLDENRKTGYSLVKLDSGEQGWVLTRYLSLEPPARGLLDGAQEEIRKLKAELVALRGGQESADPSSQRAEIERLNTELIAIRQASANALQIQQERDRLQERVIDLERDLETVRREKSALDGDSQDWFLIGAGVLFAGILLGILLPRLNWRKRSHWDSF